MFYLLVVAGFLFFIIVIRLIFSTLHICKAYKDEHYVDNYKKAKEGKKFDPTQFEGFNRQFTKYEDKDEQILSDEYEGEEVKKQNSNTNASTSKRVQFDSEKVNEGIQTLYMKGDPMIDSKKEYEGNNSPLKPKPKPYVQRSNKVVPAQRSNKDAHDFTQDHMVADQAVHTSIHVGSQVDFEQSDTPSVHLESIEISDES